LSKNQPSLGAVYFWSDSPAFHFQCLLGPVSPNPAKGKQMYGGWKEVKRKRRRSLKEWDGVDGLAIEIPIIIDGFAQEKSVENEVATLEHLAGRKQSGQQSEEPPLMYFNSGGVVPHDYHKNPGIDWVIGDIIWGDADRREDGIRTRQAATVIVEEHVEDDVLGALTSAQRRKLAQSKRAKKKGKGAKQGKESRYVVKEGETLEKIAASQLGNSARWHELKKLNPSIRDPNKPLRAGTIVIMP